MGIRMLKGMFGLVKRHQAQLMEFIGFGALSTGVGMVYLPAGLIVAGISCWFLAQGAEQA